MEKKRIVSVIMAVLMALSLLPSMVFAAAPGALGGRLRIKGDAAVGSVLQAEYSKAEPQGLTDDDVSLKWSRKISDTELKEVGTDKKYTVTEDDLGYKLVLEVTGREDRGMSGTLKAETLKVTDTPEEAKALVEEKLAEGKTLDIVPAGEEDYNELAGAELLETDSPEPVIEENYEEILPEEEPSQDEIYYEEDMPDYSEDVTVEEPENADTEDGEFEITVSEEVNMGGESGDGMEAVPEEEVYAAEVLTEDGTGIVDFGTVKAGEEAEEALFVTVKNTGNQTLHFEEIAPKHFMAADITEPLKPGEEISLWIQPREGLSGSYDDTITYETEEGMTVSYQAKAVVEAGETAEEPEAEPEKEPETETETTEEPETEETPEAPVYELSADMDAMIFGSMKEGYEEVTELQYVTLTNTGEPAVTVKLPEGAQYVDILADKEAEADLVLEKGESIRFGVRPKTGIAAGSYSETLSFGIAEAEAVVRQVAVTVTVEPAEETVVKVSADPSVWEFETMTEGYEEMESVTVTLTNEGNTDLALEQPLAESFDIGALSSAELPAGGSVTFTVWPKAGLKEGAYVETVKIFRASKENELLASVETSVAVEAPEAVYKLSVTPEYLDFGEVKAGYGEAPSAQKITVINEGTAAVELEKPEADYFKIGSLSRTVLEPGEKASFAVRPKNGLDESTYIETIRIPNDADIDLQVDAEFAVTRQAVVLTGIQKPKAVAGVKNGAEKSAKGLGLPSQAVIETTDGKMKAKLQWNVEECDYDRSVKEEQNFKVAGKVVLPDGVENPDKISRNVSVKVNVKAAYVPKVPDASGNKIKGMSSGGYTTQSRISFEAVGAGMENTSPRKGDVRFLPTKWKVINTNKWDEAPYSATFGITKAGTYTLSVLFERQKFDGEAWENTGEQDTKRVEFTISQAKQVTPTPTAQQRNADRKSAVATGDSTPILPFVIILVAAVGCIAAVIVYRKKR